MKKIVYGYTYTLDMLDPKDYIIIEEDNQRISDKYVDYDGYKINEYWGSKALKKGDVVIKGFYYIWFGDYTCTSVGFNKFKYYERYKEGKEYTSGLKKGLKIKNSIFNFNYVKKKIVEIFSKDIRIKIQ